MKVLYRSLRAAMVEAGLDQSEFAALMGIPVRTLSNKINGHTDWTCREMYKALDILGREAKDLHVLFPANGQDRSNERRAAQRFPNVFIMPRRAITEE